MTKSRKIFIVVSIIVLVFTTLFGIFSLQNSRVSRSQANFGCPQGYTDTGTDCISIKENRKECSKGDKYEDGVCTSEYKGCVDGGEKSGDQCKATNTNPMYADYNCFAGGIDVILSYCNLIVAGVCSLRPSTDVYYRCKIPGTKLRFRIWIKAAYYFGPLVCDPLAFPANGGDIIKVKYSWGYPVVGEYHPGKEHTVCGIYTPQVINYQTDLDHGSKEKDVDKNLVEYEPFCPKGWKVYSDKNCIKVVPKNSFLLNLLTMLGQAVCNNSGGNLATCIFNLINLPSGGPLVTPADGIQATLPNGTKVECEIEASQLICKDIPTDQLQGGQNPVNLSSGSTSTVNTNTAIIIPTIPVSDNAIISSDCDGTKVAALTNTYTCTYILDQANKYTLPQSGVVARTQQGNLNSAISDPCVINSQNNLVCSNIPTDPGMVIGEARVGLRFGTSQNFIDKGGLILDDEIIIISQSDLANASDCVEQNSLVTCSFAITNPNPDEYDYELPGSGIRMRLSNGQYSEPCYLKNNNTAQNANQNPTLVCPNAPVVSNQSGQQIELTIGNGNPTQKGTATIQNSRTTITNANIFETNSCNSVVKNDGKTAMNCTFEIYGNPLNAYQVTNATQVSLGTNTVSTQDCTIRDNYTEKARLYCKDIPVQQGDKGLLDVFVTDSTQAKLKKGQAYLSIFIPPDVDNDGDGIKNSLECSTPDAGCEDTDLDGIPDYNDKDNDGDGIPDELERGAGCGSLTSCTLVDSDSDGKKDIVDTDSDNDGVLDEFERGSECLSVSSCVLVDTDNDGRKNVVDSDDDNDKILSKQEQNDPNGDGNDEDAVDSDQDGVPDYLDSDVVSDFTNTDFKTLKETANFVCTPSQVEINQEVNCSGKLALLKRAPKNGIQVRIEGQTAVNCTFSSQTTTGPNITCPRIKVGTTTGKKQVQARIGSNLIPIAQSQSTLNEFGKWLGGIDAHAQNDPFTNVGITIDVVAAGAISSLPRSGGVSGLIGVLSMLAGIGCIGFLIHHKKIKRIN
jgi:hypothetical protein